VASKQLPPRRSSSLGLANLVLDHATACHVLHLL
jgi:hypothetical protein